MLGVTLAYVVISLGLLVQTRTANRSAKAAATAAENSARAAQLALSVERPYLLISSLDFGGELPLSGFDEDDGESRIVQLPAPIATFTNYGRTPAIVTRLQASFEPVECVDSTDKHKAHKGLLHNLVEEPLKQQGVPANGDFTHTILTRGERGLGIAKDMYESLGYFDWTIVV